MISRTRKNKTRILIVYGQGIASAFAVELAMLFSHAGSEVRAALIDNAEDWVAKSPLQQICGHSVLKSDHQPNWYFSSQTFDAALVISPSNFSQQQFISSLASDPIIDFALKRSKTIYILQNKQLMPDVEACSFQHTVFTEIPAQPLQLNQFFQKVFSAVIAGLAARKKLEKKTFHINYKVPNALKAVVPASQTWLRKLSEAFVSAGFSATEGFVDNPDVFIEAYDGPMIDAEAKLYFATPVEQLEQENQTDGHRLIRITFVASHISDNRLTPTEKHIFIKRLPNGIKLFDNHGTRLFPDVTGHCSFARLALYIATKISHETVADAPPRI
ncbi:MAG: hypothetical protein PHV05_00245 [Candidatus Riflebacteria bacterium]|nr:hypothetical protein [Candidatus Riflebacteria bacterium]